MWINRRAKREHDAAVQAKIEHADAAIKKSEHALESSKRLRQYVEDGTSWLARLNQENHFADKLRDAYGQH